MKELLRAVPTITGVHPGIRLFAGEVTTDATRTFIVETGCVYVSNALAVSDADAIVQGVVGSSTAHPGTKKVTFTLPIATYQITIFGSTEATLARSITADTTVDLSAL